jgi:hypothetical protein
MSSEKIVTYISNIDPEIYDYKRDDSLQDNENYYNLFNLTNLMEVRNLKNEPSVIEAIESKLLEIEFHEKINKRIYNKGEDEYSGILLDSTISYISKHLGLKDSPKLKSLAKNTLIELFSKGYKLGKNIKFGRNHLGEYIDAWDLSGDKEVITAARALAHEALACREGITYAYHAEGFVGYALKLSEVFGLEIEKDERAIQQVKDMSRDVIKLQLEYWSKNLLELPSDKKEKQFKIQKEMVELEGKKLIDDFISADLGRFSGYFAYRI